MICVVCVIILQLKVVTGCSIRAAILAYFPTISKGKKLKYVWKMPIFAKTAAKQRVKLLSSHYSQATTLGCGNTLTGLPLTIPYASLTKSQHPRRFLELSLRNSRLFTHVRCLGVLAYPGGPWRNENWSKNYKVVLVLVPNLESPGREGSKGHVWLQRTCLAKRETSTVGLKHEHGWWNLIKCYPPH